MNETTAPQSAGWRMKVAIFALCASIFAVLWFMVAALGTKWGFWPWQVGLGQMTIGLGPQIAMLAVALSVIAQIIALIKAPRVQPFIIALAATLISAMCLFRLAGLGGQAAALPPIHDVQTDWADPIRYSSAIMQAREADGETNPVLDAPTVPDYAEERWPGTAGRLVSELQEEAEAKEGGKDTVLPAMQPFYFSQPPNEVAALAINLIDRRGWTLVTEPGTASDLGTELQVEATAVSGWFGFKDDVAIRIRPVEGATRVDMRSTSRVGLSDLGANSKRVAGFMNELQDRGDGRPAP
ncbi:MAG: DUF1499 domain-containing protein [Henriciella sp.]|nr:DUF1499 domain-containing protein [Henriciella sp.]